MSELAETIKPVGSLVGLATGLFVVIDRLFSHRPLVAWSRIEHSVIISVRNVATESLIVERIQVRPDGWALAWGGSLGDTIEAAAKAIRFADEKDDPLAFVHAPGAVRTFHHVSNGREEIIASGPKITIYWRSCRNRWLPQIPVTLSANKRFLALLREARI